MIAPLGSEGFYEHDGARYYHGPLERRHLPDDIATVVEFGSWDGGDGLRYKFWFPHAAVYSLECDPDRYEIVKRVWRYGVETYRLAIGAKAGLAPFYRCLDPDYGIGGSGSLFRKTPAARALHPELSYPDEPIMVPVKTLAEFCHCQSVGPIDLLHVDTEGAEWEVLEGMGSLRPRFVLLEKHVSDNANIGARPAADVAARMRGWGYEIVAQGGCDDLHEYRGKR